MENPWNHGILDNMDREEFRMTTALVRNSLKKTSNITLQPRLWQDQIGCSLLNKTHAEPCVLTPVTLSNLSDLSNPYLAQLPVGYHTGLTKQFIPRINLAVKWDSVSHEDMPVDCGGMPNSFYVHYANAIWPPEA